MMLNEEKENRESKEEEINNFYLAKYDQAKEYILELEKEIDILKEKTGLDDSK